MRTSLLCIGMMILFVAGLLTGLNQGATYLSLVMTASAFLLVAWVDYEAS